MYVPLISRAKTADISRLFEAFNASRYTIIKSNPCPFPERVQNLLRTGLGYDHTPVSAFVGRRLGDILVVRAKSSQQEDDISPAKLVHKAKDAFVLDRHIEKRGDVETGGVANVNVVLCVF